MADFFGLPVILNLAVDYVKMAKTKIIGRGIGLLRSLFYNTPVRNWRVTAYLHGLASGFLVGNEKFPLVDIGGLRLKANGKDASITTPLLNGHYEPYTLNLFHRLLEDLNKPGMPMAVFADVGANIGIFSVQAAAKSSRMRVYAFEPNPESRALLEENARANQLENITIVGSAVGSEAGSCSLDVSSNNAGMHSLLGRGKNRVTVPLISLDDFFADKPKPVLVKVDVEGYEPKVLAGMKSILAQSEVKIILEFNPKNLGMGAVEPGQFLAQLESMFEAIYCLDEITGKALPYQKGNAGLTGRILKSGFNLLLLKGKKPAFLE